MANGLHIYVPQDQWDGSLKGALFDYYVEYENEQILSGRTRNWNQVIDLMKREVMGY